MDFFLFVLVNVTLFIRPAELVPAMRGLPIYNYLMVINLLVAAPAIINHLMQGTLRAKPATFCVLGVLVGVFLSHFVKLDFWSARFGAIEFLKVTAYFLLLITTVNSRSRFYAFLTLIAFLVLAITGIATLHYHGIIQLDSLTVLMQNDIDPNTGMLFTTPRMQATGIFGDPNDLSMIIVLGITILAAGFFNSRLGFARFLCAVPLGVLLYALTLTQSRGGLLALLAAMVTLFYARFGKAKAAMMGALVIPVALVIVGGRQADIGGAISGGTGATRAELWSEGLQEFKSAPVFGIGYKMYSDQVGQVAHNSFLHALTELGVVGGMPFIGLFALLGISLWQVNKVRSEINDPTVQYLLPFVMAMLAAYIISMMSLSRSYALPTYLVAGTASVFVAICRKSVDLGPVTVSARLIACLVGIAMAFLAFVYLYVKLSVRLG